MESSRRTTEQPAETAGPRSVLRALPDDRRVRLAVAGVLVGFLAFQLVFLPGRHAAPFSDMTGYDQRALLLLREHTFQTGTPYGATYHGPGYLVFLAAIYGVAGHRWWAVYVVQSLLSALTLLGIYLIAGRLFSRRVAVISLLLAAGYLPFLAYAHVLMPETLFIACVVFSVYACARGVSQSSLAWLSLSGILCGLASLIRSIGMLFPAVFILWIALSPQSSWSRRRVSSLALLLLCMVLVLAPWTVHNYLDQGRFIPGDTVGGLNLLIGNRPGANGFGVVDPVWSNPAVRQALSEGKREAALDDVFRSQALAWIWAHPGSFLALTGWRVILFLSMTRDWLIRGIGSTALDTASGFQQVYTEVLLFFAIVGGFAGLRGRRPSLLPLLTFSYFLAAVSVFYFQTRYRLPAMPFVIMLAAYGISVVGTHLERGVIRSRGLRPSPSQSARHGRSPDDQPEDARV